MKMQVHSVPAAGAPKTFIDGLVEAARKFAAVLKPPVSVDLEACGLLASALHGIALGLDGKERTGAIQLFRKLAQHLERQ